MNTRFLVRAILAAANLTAFNAAAADLKEVYTRALTNDPLIREAEANRLATRESKPQAVASLLPQIAANASELKNESTGSQTVIDIDEVDGDVTIGSAQRETKGTRQVWNVELRQSIFRWQNWAELSRANVEGAQAEAEYVVAQQDLIVRTAEAYFNVLAARDTLEAAQAAHDAIGRQLEQSEKRFEVGLIAVTDVQDAKAAYDSATAALIQGKRNLANAGELLRELTGDAWDTLEKAGNDMPLESPDPENPEDWVKLAMEQNASLNSSRLAAEITRANINVERGGHIPAVDFIVRRGHDESEGFQSGTSPGDTSSDSYDTVYGLQVTVPIFSGGLTSSRVRQAQYRHTAARERLERTARATERSTRDAYLGVNSEVARVQSL